MSGLLATFCRVKINPNQIARIGYVSAYHYQTSLSFGSPQSIFSWRFSGVMSLTSSASVNTGSLRTGSIINLPSTRSIFTSSSIFRLSACINVAGIRTAGEFPQRFTLLWIITLSSNRDHM
ncbi:hypothetical protein UTI89_C3152 [Escherichia coli UTI89]|uniref:Uncharacterized protein n=1 Tax=Escherichia coli (strain UTI89 / UPEC) TaxID=364106 RepID=Q1R7R0_ECOUT|nr:hypothetical protein UTI89_C3152 [Escherichia coli UTI89]